MVEWTLFCSGGGEVLTPERFGIAVPAIGPQPDKHFPQHLAHPVRKELDRRVAASLASIMRPLVCHLVQRGNQPTLPQAPMAHLDLAVGSAERRASPRPRPPLLCHLTHLHATLFHLCPRAGWSLCPLPLFAAPQCLEVFAVLFAPLGRR